MICIYCGSDTKVINSRPQKRHNYIWRRRQCIKCGAVFTTSEVPDLFKGLMVLTGAQMQPFSRDKLFLSVYDSLRHRKTAITDTTALTDTIISRLYPNASSGSLDSHEIAQITINVLKRFDKAAAIHYEAFHPLGSRS